MDFENIWRSIAECWHVKMFVSCLTTIATFLVGDFTAAPFLGLWALVAIDTITRWMAIGKKTLADHDMTGTLWDGIWLAVIEKKINSEAMRGQFTTKAIAYLILLIGFNLLDTIIPDRVAGTTIDGLPNTFISTWLAFVELQSIIENLIEVGMTGLTPLSNWVCKKKDKMTGACEIPKQSEGEVKNP